MGVLLGGSALTPFTPSPHNSSLLHSELLQQFTSAESLEGKEYLCTVCDTGSLQCANKQLMIAEHPQVSRFVTSSSNFHNSSSPSNLLFPSLPSPSPPGIHPKGSTDTLEAVQMVWQNSAQDQSAHSVSIAARPWAILQISFHCNWGCGLPAVKCDRPSWHGVPIRSLHCVLLEL